MYTYRVESVDRITPSTIRLNLVANPAKKALQYHPGQYAAISFHRHGRPTPVRCFSIVSSPTQPGILSFSMRTRGHFTKGLADLQAGDKVTVEGAYGGFVLTNPRDLKTVFIAGGIGITPFMSMARQAADDHDINQIRLLYSCAAQDDVPFFDELQQLQAQNPNFKVVFYIGNGPTDKLIGANVLTGRISADSLDLIVGEHYSDASFFICGPPPFMNGMLKMLRTKKVPSRNLITEAFSQGSHRQTGKLRSWPLNMYALGSLGFVAASFTIIVTDILRTLPIATFLPTANQQARLVKPNGRQRDLDALVNELATTQNSAPVSSAVAASQVATPATVTTPTSAATSSSSGNVATTAKSSTVATTTRTTSPVSTGGSSSSTPTPAPTPAPTPTPTPTPTPAPTPTPTPTPKPPVCTTSPSGVKTCK